MLFFLNLRMSDFKNFNVSNTHFISHYSLKINELIQFSQAGIYFLTQLLLKIPIFELINLFVFLRT